MIIPLRYESASILHKMTLQNQSWFYSRQLPAQRKEAVNMLNFTFDGKEINCPYKKQDRNPVFHFLMQVRSRFRELFRKTAGTAAR